MVAEDSSRADNRPEIPDDLKEQAWSLWERAFADIAALANEDRPIELPRDLPVIMGCLNLVAGEILARRAKRMGGL